jgi:predicted enzyme related to lactoylglutathione lyase
MPRVVHFEIAANDPEKVVAFYQGVFSWEINKWPGPVDYWLIKTGDPSTPGMDGGLFRPSEWFNGTVNSISVDDIDASLVKIRAAGGQSVTEKSTVPGVGYQIYCKDNEGNLFDLHQTDPKAGMP